jgi:hypothetical protein
MKIITFSTFLAILIVNIMSLQMTGFSKLSLNDLFTQQIAQAEYSECWNCDAHYTKMTYYCPPGSEEEVGIHHILFVTCYNDDVYGQYDADFSCDENWGIDCDGSLWNSSCICMDDVWDML